jgi:hypothetical protein
MLDMRRTWDCLRVLLCVLLIFGFLSEDLTAVQKAPPPDAAWNRVQSLKPGEKVEVHRITKKKLRGALVSVASDSITVEVQNLPIAIPRSEIRRLKVESESQRSKNAAIGAGIGAGGGIAAAIILDGALTDGNGVSGSAAVLLGGLGSAAGFVIRIMRRAYKTIYE